MQRQIVCVWALLFLSLVVSNGVLCSGTQQINSKQSSQPSSSTQQASATTSSSMTTSKQTTLTPTTTTQRPETNLANLLNHMRSNLAGPQKDSSSDLNNDDHYSNFDGKNPFYDDSLWRIPIQLARDLGVSRKMGDDSSNNGQRETLTKSASESQGREHHLMADEASENDDESSENDQNEPISSASPTIISASTSYPSAASANPSTSSDLKTAAGYHHASPAHHGSGYHDGHHGHHDYHGKYYQYASVPYPYSWDFGYRRGNPYHTIERHEHGKGPHFQTKVKWSDKYGGYGVHVWDYNHDDHHSHHYGGANDHHYGQHDDHQGYEKGPHHLAHHGYAHHGYGHH